MSRPTGVFKTENDYQKMMSRVLYEKIPKAVLAGIVVSYLLNHQSIDPSFVDDRILDEWRTLNEQGIIPQKPAKIN